jgi:hypothetical protein
VSEAVRTLLVQKSIPESLEYLLFAQYHTQSLLSFIKELTSKKIATFQSVPNTVDTLVKHQHMILR